MAKKNFILETVTDHFPYIITAVVSTAATFAVLQFSVAANTRAIEEVKANYVQKEVLEPQLESISQDLGEIKSAAVDTNNKLDRLIDRLIP